MEHIMWTRSFIVSSAMDLENLESVTKRLLRNPSDFATLLKQVYGTQIATEFEKLFTEHLTIAAEFVNAAKEENSQVANKKREEWYENATDIANFLGNINPNFNKKYLQDMMFKHLELTENEATQLLTGQYAKSVYEYDTIQAQALHMADEMANGILKQLDM